MSKKYKPCSHCHYRREPFTFTLHKKPLCKICSIEYERVCKQCHQKFPAGFGTICTTCHYEKTFTHRLELFSQHYSTQIQPYFIGFAYWLKKRRGVIYSAKNLQKYVAYFNKINTLTNNLQTFPTYKQLLNFITDATHKKNYLIHIYLNEIGIITIKKNLTEEYTNHRLIQKYLQHFKKGTLSYNLIHNYYNTLLLRLQNKKTTIHSIRLSLTPAVKFLKYCQYFQEKTPTQYALEGYLFIYYGQKATLTGFINFISNTYQYELDIKIISKPRLKTPKISHQILKDRVIKMMQNPHDKHFKEAYIFRTIIGYFHWVYIPQNVFLSVKNIHKAKDGNYYITFCGESFYLPNKVVKYLLSRDQ